MDYDFERRRADLARENQLRRELDEASPSLGSAGLIIAGIILVILGVVFFGPPVGERTDVASRAPVETTAPASPQSNP